MCFSQYIYSEVWEAIKIKEKYIPYKNSILSKMVEYVTHKYPPSTTIIWHTCMDKSAFVGALGSR